MDLLQLLTGQAQAQQIGQHLGASPEQTQDALQAAVPLLLAALTRNAQQGQPQAAALEQAVAQHDGPALDQFTRSGQLPDLQDGQNILGHIFGTPAQQQAAANVVGQRSGLDPQLALQILSIAAPLVLNYLNRQRPAGATAENTAPAPAGSDITAVLTSVLGGLLAGSGAPAVAAGQPGGSSAQTTTPAPQSSAAGGLGGLLGSLNRALDRDGDGSALNEIVEMLGHRCS
ncbi:DUF937 domain-containing protein [Deinococcus sp. Marseille-Q6407]|uniref:DUF937 domain-containing protein n=1 Tax=Deinococcus sp. Marseille-Q6407 TaxID=2969223 RepID=UPI0021C199F9|nr:DUF937 domain-containing protein [Deinococcus sp. Marseille-Q6407]